MLQAGGGHTPVAMASVTVTKICPDNIWASYLKIMPHGHLQHKGLLLPINISGIIIIYYLHT